MSHGEEILGVLTDIAGDVGALKNDMEHVKKDISDLKSKKQWYQKVNWVKVGKGTAYIAAGLAAGGGGIKILLSILG